MNETNNIRDHLAVLGGTGLVGSNFLKLATNSNLKLKCFHRENLKFNEKYHDLLDKIVHINVTTEQILQGIPEDNFNNVYIGCCFFGSTNGACKKNKTSFKEFEKAAIVNFAKSCLKGGVKKFILISSVKSNSKSYLEYFKTKGEIEEEIIKMNFDNLVIYRPAILKGKRLNKRFQDCISDFSFTVFKPAMYLFGIKNLIYTKAEKLASNIVNKIMNNDFEKIEIIEAKDI